MNHEGEKYRLITKIPIIGELFIENDSFNCVFYLGDVSSDLMIHLDDRPNQFIYSVDSWLLETNSIELKDSLTSVNSTRVEWTVYTRRRSILFQVIYLLLYVILLMILSLFFSMFSYHLLNFIRIKLFVKPYFHS